MYKVVKKITIMADEIKTDFPMTFPAKGVFDPHGVGRNISEWKMFASIQKRLFAKVENTIFITM